MTPIAPACYGVMCQRHHECARYAAVDGAGGAMQFIGTCGSGWPMFILLVRGAQT